MGFVLIAAATANVAEHFVSVSLEQPGFVAFGEGGNRVGGMSGVVYALFGYIWVRGRVAPYEGLKVSRENAMIMFVWLGLCMTGIIGSVANVAHLCRPTRRDGRRLAPARTTSAEISPVSIRRLVQGASLFPGFTLLLSWAKIL